MIGRALRRYAMSKRVQEWLERLKRRAVAAGTHAAGGGRAPRCDFRIMPGSGKLLFTSEELDACLRRRHRRA